MTDDRKPKIPGWFGIATLIVLAVVALSIFSPRKVAAPPPASVADTTRPPQPAQYGGTTVNVTMSITAARLGPLTVSGETNLPDGTILSLQLRGDYPACSPKCGFELSQATVQGGKFSAKIMADNDPAPGAYTVDVMTVAGILQPPRFQALIGSNGEGLRGPFVVALGPDGKDIQVNPEQTSASQYLSGLLTHYTQRISVRDDRSIGICSNAEPVSNGACGPSRMEAVDNTAGSAVTRTAGVTGVPAQTSSETAGPQSAAPSGQASGAIETVRRFYDALGVGDGDAAASYVIPEKRQTGPLSGAELTARYSGLRTPLVLQDVLNGPNGLVYARYSYAASNGTKCLASSAVKLTERAGDLDIDEIRVNETCQ